VSGEKRRTPCQAAIAIEQHDLDRNVAAREHAKRRLLRCARR